MSKYDLRSGQMAWPSKWPRSVILNISWCIMITHKTDTMTPRTRLYSSVRSYWCQGSMTSDDVILQVILQQNVGGVCQYLICPRRQAVKLTHFEWLQLQLRPKKINSNSRQSCQHQPTPTPSLTPTPQSGCGVDALRAESTATLTLDKAADSCQYRLRIHCPARRGGEWPMLTQDLIFWYQRL